MKFISSEVTIVSWRDRSEWVLIRARDLFVLHKKITKFALYYRQGNMFSLVISLVFQNVPKLSFPRCRNGSGNFSLNFSRTVRVQI